MTEKLTTNLCTLEELIRKQDKHGITFDQFCAPDNHLSNANLHSANLTGADLSNAYLRGANLYGADLRGANLREAKGICTATIDGIPHFIHSYVFENKIRVNAGCRNMEINDYRGYIQNEEKYESQREIILAQFMVFELSLKQYLVEELEAA